MLNSPYIRDWIQGQLSLKSWSRADLARHTDTTESAWSRIFNGKTKELKPRNVEALCKAFDITKEELHDISVGRNPGDRVSEPDPVYRTKWDRLAVWIITQPEPVKHAMEAVASSHGWTA